MSKNKGVLYVGQCYYNFWYLSRELRKLGWKTELVNTDPNLSDDFYHGEDVHFLKHPYNSQVKKLEYFLYALSNFEIFHFANKKGLFFISDYDGMVNKQPHGFKRFFLKFLLNKLVKKRVGVLFRLFYFLGPSFSLKVFKFFAPAFPERWDLILLKKFDKKIAYSNNGCNDGVTKESFRKWETTTNESVCSICSWGKDDLVCNDAENNKWGTFRNNICDLQFLIGSNRADYNKSEKIRETPWAYCVDKNLWSPDILIPANYILPFHKDTVKIYHAIGNYETRSQLNSKSIKSTHIYLEVIKKLKNEGHNIEIIFFNDVPNKKIKYYQSQADIFVDMLSYGFYGANIREGLMLGKPCVCYLRGEWLDDMRKEVPDYVNEIPVVSANELTIYEVLKDLIVNTNKRKEVGRKSREFAMKWHASDVAAVKFDEIYSKLLSEN